jgi:hypothetical protein
MEYKNCVVGLSMSSKPGYGENIVLPQNRESSTKGPTNHVIAQAKTNKTKIKY